MALSFSNLTGGTATSATSATTASVSPTADALVLLSFATYKSSGNPSVTPTVSGCGLTWELVGGVVTDVSSTDYSTMWLFRALHPSPSSGTITVDFAGESQNEMQWNVDQVTGADTGGANGSAAVAQVAALNFASASASGTVDLKTQVASGNATFATFAIQKSGTLTFTVGTSFTQLGSTQATNTQGLASEYRIADADGSGSWSATTIFKSGGIAVEVAAAGQTAPRFPQVSGVSAMVGLANSTTTATAWLPPHKANDVIVVVAADNTGADITIDGSFATIVAAQNNANFSTAWWWVRATGANTANPTVTWSTTASSTIGHFVGMFVISGCAATGNPWDDAQVNGSPTSSTTPTAPNVTTTGTCRKLVYFTQIDDNNIPLTNIPPSNYMLVQNDNSSAGSDGTIMSIFRDFPTATAETGPQTCTQGASDYWRVLGVAFKPPPAIVPTPTRAMRQLVTR